MSSHMRWLEVHSLFYANFLNLTVLDKNATVLNNPGRGKISNDFVVICKK